MMHYIDKIRESEVGSGLDVYLIGGGIYKNVHRNVVRCAIGESDLDYLLKTKGEAYGAFGVSTWDLADFQKHKAD